ncbi:MAG: 50S ribosomal protein L13 [Armatimonadota bacterium]
MKSFLAKPLEVERQWLIVDATDLVLGRMASRVAILLRGKHKPTFTPSVDTGDHVIVINAEKIRVTANKLVTKIKYRHSGYPGGFKQIPLGSMMAKNPAETVRQAIIGMLPHNSLGRQMGRKLKVYSGSEHPHEAQQPVDITETFFVK